MTVNSQAQAILDLLAARGGAPVQELSPAEVRAANWDWLEFMGAPEQMTAVEDIYIPGPTAELHVRLYTPSTAQFDRELPCLVLFHGGGWTAGNLALADRPARSLAHASQCLVVAVNYQKAPEHRYPAALDDCFATFEWVVENADTLGVDPTKIGVAGDSAGGNLAAAVCLMARATGSTPPALQLLIYPAVDPDMDYPSAKDNAEGYALTTAAMAWFWDNYISVAEERTDPLAAPMRASSLSDLPAAIVITAEYDPLRDEGEAYAERLEADGVRVIQHRYPGTIHGFLWMAAALTDDFGRLMADLGKDIPTLLNDCR